VFDVKVQTPQEIIAKKLKFREKATIRDFIDYAIVKEKDKVLSRLKSQGIVDIDRYVNCQTLETLVANKMVAITDRYKLHKSIAARDLYDIHYTNKLHF